MSTRKDKKTKGQQNQKKRVLYRDVRAVSSIAQCYISLLSGIWDQHRNTNMNNKDYLVGQLTKNTEPWLPSIRLKSQHHITTSINSNHNNKKLTAFYTTLHLTVQLENHAEVPNIWYTVQLSETQL